MVLMRMVERAGDLNRITADLIGRERVLEESVQGLPGDILHDDEGDAIGFFDAVDRADMRVAQRRGGARLTQQVAPRIAGEARVQNLDRYGPAKQGVTGAIDLSHAAGADWRQNLVMAEPMPRWERDRLPPAVSYPRKRFIGAPCATHRPAESPRRSASRSR